MAVRISAALPAGAPIQFVIQPGQSTTFSIDFTNLDNEAGPGVGWARNRLDGLYSRWLVEPVDPENCWYPIPQEGLGLQFPVELLANQTRRCTYMIRRAVDTYRDGYLQICLGIQPSVLCEQRGLLVFGTLPDAGVTATATVQPTTNDPSTTFRLDFSNAASVATDESQVFTQCRYLPGGNPAVDLPFRVETGFPGACAAANIAGCSPEPPLVSYM
ncbi:MAG: hypothetical protein ABIR16_07145, partial [Dokdonella sp.]